MRSLRAARADLEEHARRLAETRAQLAGLRALAGAAQESHREHIAAALQANQEWLAATVRQTLPIENRDWDDPDWRSWQPRTEVGEIERVATMIRAGHVRETQSGIDLASTVGTRLVGRDRPLVIVSRTPEQQRVARGLLRALVVRAAALLPGRARFYLLDPAGQGAAFPMARHLGEATADTANLADALDVLLSDIGRINHEYLDALVPAFHQVPEEDRQNEVYRLLFAADYSAFYDFRSIGLLQNIASAGSRAGVYTIVHHHLDAGADHEAARAQIPGAEVIDLGQLERPFQAGGHSGPGGRIPGFTAGIVWDREPDPGMERETLARISGAKRVQRRLRWDDLGQPDHTRWWQADATERVSAPIGRQGGNRTIELTFGTTSRGQEIAHGLLVAMSGAGKTALLHTLITGLAVRYPPDELKLLLLDGKVGVEFRAYRDLPHAEVVSLNTRAEFARSIFEDLVRELVHRNELFKEAGVSSFPAYRRAGSPRGALPRLLLVADEYQVLFEDDREQVAASALQRLSDQGRSAGIHLLLGSQHFAPPNMPHRHDIFANFHLRLAMQMVPGELMSSADFGPAGRRLIRSVCDGVGKVVVSDRPGDESSYQPGTVAYLDPQRREEVVRTLARGRGEGRPALVLDGDRQPVVAESHVLRAMAMRRLRDAPAGRRAFADGVLGEPDWIPEEHPVALVLGLPFSVRGETLSVFRRRPTDGVLIIGSQHPERTAMVAASLLSLCLQLSPTELQFAVADRSVHTGQAALERAVGAAARCGYPVIYGRDDDMTERILVAAHAETARRAELGALHEPLRLLVLNEPHRVASLLQQPGRFGNEELELGGVLRTIMETGPAVGVHVLVSAGSVGELSSVMDPRRATALLRNRVGMQMSEPDSFTVVRSNAASRLQLDGPRPIAAILFDQQADRATKFRPWALDGLTEHIEEALGSLA